MVKCTYCERDFKSARGLKIHLNSCEKNIDTTESNTPILEVKPQEEKKDELIYIPTQRLSHSGTLYLPDKEIKAKALVLPDELRDKYLKEGLLKIKGE